jgi:glucose-1-phosphate adenylyltransferase
MDLLDENCELNLDDPTWKIYTEDASGLLGLPAYIGPNADIDRAYITQGCRVDGKIKNSVIFTGATVGTGAQVIDSVLMPGVVVGDGAVVTRALVADNVKIAADAVIGSADSKEILLQAQDV